jgi:hypothetical protein
MINKKKFTHICKSYFNYLTSDYDFHLVSTEEDDWGYEILFKTNAVGVSLTFEYRDFYLSVKLCRLQKGEFPPKPSEIGPDTLLECFDLDDIVLLKSKESLIPPHKLDTKLDNTLLDSIIQRQAENLKKFAKDILGGNFSLFLELDKIVKDRARTAAFQKWGKKAEEFGWTV